MTHQEIREKFRKFMEAKGHLWVASSSLLPDDPSVLFTTAGMQQFKPYYTAPKLAPAKNVASIQKCVRTSDIDEVGDESHLTFFEMLGNFSFGGYFKEEAIRYAHEFITKEMGLKISYVTVFKGDRKISRDVQSEIVWKKIDEGIEVKKCGRLDNFWGPTGIEGPCGPTTEIYVKNSAGQDIEIWNIVFNEYYGKEEYDWWTGLQDKIFNWFRLTEGKGHGNLKLTKLNMLGIDTGMGLERLAMVSENTPTIFETENLFAPLMALMPEDMDVRVRRIIADHTRAISFLISDGVIPSNKEQGYVLRKLIRRMMTYSYLYLTRPSYKVRGFNYEDIIKEVCRQFKLDFENIRNVVRVEYTRFSDALSQGIIALKKFFNKFIGGVDPQNLEPAISNNIISGKGLGVELFNIYQSKGLHPDIAKDILQQWGLILDKSVIEEYSVVLEQERIAHQEKSRTASAGMFKGGLAGTSDVEVRYHTATHLLNAALHKVLGENVVQRGSNINAERTRFDFSHSAKLTDEEKTKVEELVNGWIRRDLPVVREEIPLQKARELGAIGAFGEKYGDMVSVYTVSDPETGEVISREFCGGPHVTHTGEVGAFKIIKEEAVSAGVRRIRAVVQ